MIIIKLKINFFFRIIDLENKCERLIKTNRELEDKISACDEQIKVYLGHNFVGYLSLNKKI